ncbi:MAG: hypothetical protein LUE65_08625 [Clostridiales bacterium]|nr:hypothetical protein [Clostridiales bacterium]
MKKKALAFLLSFIMVISLFPSAAFAFEANSDGETVTVSITATANTRDSDDNYHGYGSANVWRSFAADYLTIETSVTCTIADDGSIAVPQPTSTDGTKNNCAYIADGSGGWICSELRVTLSSGDYEYVSANSDGTFTLTED